MHRRGAVYGLDAVRAGDDGVHRAAEDLVENVHREEERALVAHELAHGLEQVRASVRRKLVYASFWPFFGVYYDFQEKRKS